jgi:hypothetical protein
MTPGSPEWVAANEQLMRENGWDWRGGCFSLALQAMLELWEKGDDEVDNLRLGMGLVRHSFSVDEWIGHAWVEIPTAHIECEDRVFEATFALVFDPSQPDPGARLLPRDVFMARTEARDVRLFTLDEALVFVQENRHRKLWEKPL